MIRYELQKLVGRFLIRPLIKLLIFLLAGRSEVRVGLKYEKLAKVIIQSEYEDFCKIDKRTLSLVRGDKL